MGNSPNPSDNDVSEQLPSDALADTWFRQGLALFNQQRYNEAIPYFDQALDLNPRLISALSCRAAAFTEVGDYIAGLADTERVLAQSGPEVASQGKVIFLVESLRARLLFLLARYTEALTVFAALQRMQPLTPHLWTLLAATFRALQQHKEAVAAYYQAMNHPAREELLTATTGATWTDVSQYLLDQQAPASALAASHLAQLADPGSELGWGLQAQALLALKRPDDALIAANRALAVNDGYVAGWLSRARACRALKQISEAHVAYEHTRALLSPTDPLWKQLVSEEGNMLLRAGRVREMTALFQASSKRLVDARKEFPRTDM